MKTDFPNFFFLYLIIKSQEQNIRICEMLYN